MQIALSYEKAAKLAAAGRLNDQTARRVLREVATITSSTVAVDSLTVRQFLAERLLSLPSRYKGRTREKFAFALEHFLEKSGLADAPLTAVGPADAAEWRDALKAEGLGVATVNGHLGVLAAEFREAGVRGLIDRNPWPEAKLGGARKGKQRREAFTFQQFQDLLAALSLANCPLKHAAEWRLLVMVAAYTGQRRTDCLNLQAEQVDLRGGLIRFWRSKNRDWHVVPLHPALSRALAVVLAHLEKGALFPVLSKLPRTGRRSVSDQFRQRVLPLIGLEQPYEDAAGSRGRKLAAYSFHSLRHSLSTWLNNAGVSDVDRMKTVGHSDRGVSLGYTHADFEGAKRAIALLPDAEKETPPANPCGPTGGVPATGN